MEPPARCGVIKGIPFIDQGYDKAAMTLKALYGLGACVLGFGLALPAAGALGQVTCSLPVQPVCSTGVQGVDTASAKSRCESDVTKYIQDLQAYRGCLNAASEKAQEQIDMAGRFRDCMKEDREDCAFNSRR